VTQNEKKENWEKAKEANMSENHFLSS